MPTLRRSRIEEKRVKRESPGWFVWGEFRGAETRRARLRTGPVPSGGPGSESPVPGGREGNGSSPDLVLAGAQLPLAGAVGPGAGRVTRHSLARHFLDRMGPPPAPCAPGKGGFTALEAPPGLCARGGNRLWSKRNHFPLFRGRRARLRTGPVPSSGRERKSPVPGGQGFEGGAPPLPGGARGRGRAHSVEEAAS